MSRRACLIALAAVLLLGPPAVAADFGPVEVADPASPVAEGFVDASAAQLAVAPDGNALWGRREAASNQMAIYGRCAAGQPQWRREALLGTPDASTAPVGMKLAANG